MSNARHGHEGCPGRCRSTETKRGTANPEPCSPIPHTSCHLPLPRLAWRITGDQGMGWQRKLGENPSQPGLPLHRDALLLQ